MNPNSMVFDVVSPEPAHAEPVAEAALREIRA
jgi:hypothetical protein